jgi:hypothetical protein
MRIRYFSLIILLLISGLTAQAQGKSTGSFSIFTGDGYLHIVNGSDVSFMIEIKAKPIKAVKAGDNPAYDLNGTLIQVVLVPFENFMPSGKATDSDAILELHKKWESDYVQNDIYHKKIDLKVEKLSVGDRKMLFWGFERPSLKDEYDRDYFLTTIIGNRVVGLSSPIKPGALVADRKKLFIDILSTIKVQNEPYDLDKLAERIRKGTLKGD